MTGTTGAVAISDGRRLLRRAIAYALLCAHDLQPAELRRATPCAGWDLRMLLRHANDSLAALQQAVENGVVAHANREPLSATLDPARAFRIAAGRLLRSSARIPIADGAVAIDGHPLSISVVAVTGAVEIAVHGWDIATARGTRLPLPGSLARELLALLPTIVPDRSRLFAEPITVPASAAPGDRLVAWLGRRP